MSFYVWYASSPAEAAPQQAARGRLDGFRGLALAAACLFAAGCGGMDDPFGPRANAASASALRARLGGEVAESTEEAVSDSGSGWATLVGQFIYEGDPPAPQRKQGVGGDDLAYCTANGYPMVESLQVDSTSKGIANVVIFARSVPRVHEDVESVPDTGPVFDQENCTFVTHVLAARVGQEIVLKNSDRVGHNTKIGGKSANQLNETIEGGAQTTYAPQVEEALPVPVACSIHPWMNAYLLPRSNGYFAVTDRDGSFSIPNLPAGVELEFQVWHELAGGSGMLALSTPKAKELSWSRKGRFKITLNADETHELNLLVPPDALGG